MTNVTDADLFDRLEALLGAIPGITTVITDDECELTDADLPAVIVMIADGTQSRDNRDYWTGDTNIEIGALFTRLCGDTLTEQRTQMRAALALRDVIPDALNPLDRLTLNNRPMNGIDQPSVMTKSRLETRPWGENIYYATTYRFTIPTERR